MHVDNPFKWKIIFHNGKKMHEGVGALIRRGDQFLLVQRRFAPFGYGLVAGHMDIGESNEQALSREILEEIAARASDFKYLFDVEDAEKHHFFKHYSHIYSCEIDREPRVNYESKSYGWFTPNELVKLKLTETTLKIFQRLGVIK